MSAWVASDAWGGWVAEIGPYSGPWPPAPPIPANLPAAAGEIDYYFMPGGTTVEQVAANGYGEGIDLYRYWTGATTAANSGFPYADSQPADPVLFVAWYAPDFSWPAPAPTADPARVVPPLYGGNGAPVPDPRNGAWSPWQPGFQESGTADAARYYGQAGSGGEVSGYTDFEGYVRDDQTALGAGFPGLTWGPVSASSVDATTEVIFASEKLRINPGDPGTTKHSAGANVAATTYQAVAPQLIDPTGVGAMSYKIEGLDYAYPPPPPPGGVQVGFGVFEDGALTFDGWADMDAQYEIYSGPYHHPDPAGYHSEAVTFWYRVVSTTAVIGGPPFGDGILYGAEVTQSVFTDATAASAGPPATIPVTLALSQVPGDSFGLTVANKYVDTSPVDHTLSPQTLIDYPGLDPTGDVQGDVDYDVSLVNANPKPLYLTPRWQYWQLDAAVLRTVGGHFDTPAGVTVKMLQPSGRWLPVVKNA